MGALSFSTRIVLCAGSFLAAIALSLGVLCGALQAQALPRTPDLFAPRPGDPPRVRVPRAPLPKGAVTLVPSTEATSRATHVRPAAGESAVQMPVAVEGVSGESDTQRELRVLGQAGRITQTPQGQPAVELPTEGRVLVSSEPARAGAAESTIEIERKTPLPWLVVDTRRSGEDTVVRASRPFLQLKHAIVWDPAAHKHVAELLFGVDREGPRVLDGDALTPPLSARFSVSCESVTPEVREVSKLGPAGYDTLRVECSPGVKNSLRQQHVEVHMDGGSLRYPFEIPRRVGAPLLQASSTRVLGLGMGALTLRVLRREEDGSPLPAERDLTVSLTTSSAALEQSELTLARGQSAASITLHPSGTGALRIEADIGGVRSLPVQIERAWPVLPVLAMLLGGTLGGVLSGLLRTKKRALPRRSLEGALVGVLVTAFVLLVPTFATLLPAWAGGTELGLFVVAALSGFVGTPLLDRAATALFPALKTASD